MNVDWRCVLPRPCPETHIWRIIQYANRPYKCRNSFDRIFPGSGIYYADDYTKMFESSKSWITLPGLINPLFWEVSHSHFYAMKNNVSASKALDAFWTGITFADCGNVIQAAMKATRSLISK